MPQRILELRCLHCDSAVSTPGGPSETPALEVPSCQATQSSGRDKPRWQGVGWGAGQKLSRCPPSARLEPSCSGAGEASCALWGLLLSSASLTSMKLANSGAGVWEEGRLAGPTRGALSLGDEEGMRHKVEKEPGHEHRVLSMQQQAVVETQKAHSLSPSRIPHQPGERGSQFPADSSMPVWHNIFGGVRFM